jgi:membrane protein implicated in regulation of membrane protease activity
VQPQTLPFLGSWSWFILAVLLFILETALPGVHFLWFGLAAVLVGVMAVATDLTWPWQALAFGVIAVLMVFAVRRVSRIEAREGDLSDLNARAQQYVGQSLVLAEAIENGRGKVRVGDSLWQAEGPDLPSGARVKVTAANGTVLVVEPSAG